MLDILAALTCAASFLEVLYFMNLNRLMKENVKIVENVNYYPSDRLTDENGNPQVWVLRPLTTKEVDAITERCTNTENKIEFNSRGKRKVKKDVELRTKELADEMVLASLVDPSREDFQDAKLQDDWGVFNELDLLKALLLPGEYTDLVQEVQRLSGYDIDLVNSVENEAKKN